MSKLGRIVTVAVFAIAIAAVALPRLLPKTGADSAAPNTGRAADRPRPVLVETVKRVPLEERLSTTGTLRANEQIEVSSEISGQVESVHFREGSAVEEGQILVRLVSTEIRAERDRSAHRAALAARREDRQRKLLEGDLISQEEYDLVRTELEVLQAELAVAEARLEKTQVRAAFGGVVGLRNVSPGAYVTPQTVIASLQDVDPMKVDFSVPERYAGRIERGKHVGLNVAGIDQRFDAVIDAVEPAVDPETRSIVVRARLRNPTGRLRPGAFADVTVQIASVPDALAVPSVAIIPELGGKKVLIVEGDVVAERHVETGIRTDTHIEVRSGLSEGDRVIVGGIERVTAGIRVEASERP